VGNGKKISAFYCFLLFILRHKKGVTCSPSTFDNIRRVLLLLLNAVGECVEKKESRTQLRAGKLSANVCRVTVELWKGNLKFAEGNESPFTFNDVCFV